jgi:anaerobic ribonucleoside-triphosphate reductase
MTVDSVYQKVGSNKKISVDLLRDDIPFTTVISQDVGVAIAHSTTWDKCEKCNWLCYTVYSYREIIYRKCNHCGNERCNVSWYSRTTRILQGKLAQAFPETFGQALAEEYEKEARQKKEDRKAARR